MKKAVLLDRDGTLIVDKIYLNDPGQVEYFPDAFDALKLLRDAGYIFIVVTNQSGVPRGLVQVENIEKIHSIIRADFARHGVEIAGFYYAPYSVESNHHMRKPNPGMLEQAAADHDIDLTKSWMVGDRMSDVEAGHRAGTKSILLAGVETPASMPFAPPEAYVATLLEAAQFIVSA